MSTPAELKKSYYEYVQAQNKGKVVEGNSFYLEMADAVYKATERCLNPNTTDMSILAAQTGSGKSSYMMAMVAALCDKGFTCAILAKTINQAHEIYEKVAILIKEPTGDAFDTKAIEELRSSLSPKRLAIYTSMHKVGSNSYLDNQNFKLGKVEGFNRNDKVISPIVISTHAALLIEIENQRDTGIMKHNEKMRDVIFLDESPDFTIAGIIKKGDIESIKDELSFKSFPSENDALTKLQNSFQKTIDDSSDTDSGQYCTKLDLLTPDLERLFIDTHNEQYSSGAKKISLPEYFDKKGKSQNYSDFIKFLKALKFGQYFISNNDGRITYSRSLFLNNPAFLMLDATAGIEDFQELNKLSKASIISSPTVNYKNLQIRHILPPKEYTGYQTSDRSNKYLSDYKKYILNTVVGYTKDSEEVLVVAKKSVVKQIYKVERIDAYHPLDYENRKIHIIYYGNFIGENEWKNIKKTFVFTGYQRPKDIYIGLDAAYNGISNDVLKKQSGSKLQDNVFRIQENEILKWFKQLSARGNVRNIDSNGNAGEMDLYTDIDIIWLIKNQKRGFPKSPKIQFEYDKLKSDVNAKIKLVMFLVNNKVGICSYHDVATAIGHKDANQISRFLKKEEISITLKYFGWQLANKSSTPNFKGKGNKRIVNYSIYKH